MATVYAARDRTLGRIVAVKVVRDQLCAIPEAVARFVDEARAVARLKSEHIAAIYDVGQHQRQPFIVMEHLRGLDLIDLMRQRGRLTAHQAEWFVLQACEGLAAAHRHGIVHRDIKPENLFVAKGVDGRELLKVLDFGVSKLPRPSAGASETRHTLGSPSYMAPEQARSPDQVDARADVWSLGAVLYTLVTGQPPFDGDTPEEILSKVLLENPTPVADLAGGVPMRTVAVIERCLAKSPGARYDNVYELACELARDGDRQFRDVAARTGRALGIDVESRRSLQPSSVSIDDPIEIPTRSYAWAMLATAVLLGGACLTAAHVRGWTLASLPSPAALVAGDGKALAVATATPPPAEQPLPITVDPAQAAEASDGVSDVAGAAAEPSAANGTRAASIRRRTRAPSQKVDLPEDMPTVTAEPVEPKTKQGDSAPPSESRVSSESSAAADGDPAPGTGADNPTVEEPKAAEPPSEIVRNIDALDPPDPSIPPSL